jgi:ADP-ribose pyrophosphatase YjhB (NUDIX family)
MFNFQAMQQALVQANLQRTPVPALVSTSLILGYQCSILGGDLNVIHQREVVLDPVTKKVMKTLKERMIDLNKGFQTLWSQQPIQIPSSVKTAHNSNQSVCQFFFAKKNDPDVFTQEYMQMDAIGSQQWQRTINLCNGKISTWCMLASVSSVPHAVNKLAASSSSSSNQVTHAVAASAPHVAKMAASPSSSSNQKAHVPVSSLQKKLSEVLHCAVCRKAVDGSIPGYSFCSHACRRAAFINFAGAGLIVLGKYKSTGAQPQSIQRVLMGKDRSAHGQQHGFENPGGKRDQDSCPAKTAAREFVEEFGLHLDQTRFDQLVQWLLTDAPILLKPCGRNSYYFNFVVVLNSASTTQMTAHAAQRIANPNVRQDSKEMDVFKHITWNGQCWVDVRTNSSVAKVRSRDEGVARFALLKLYPHLVSCKFLSLNKLGIWKDSHGYLSEQHQCK